MCRLILFEPRVLPYGSGRARYIHQENHLRNKTDTRGGVYGELNLVDEKHLSKFVDFLPNEAQVAQVTEQA